MSLEPTRGLVISPVEIGGLPVRSACFRLKAQMDAFALMLQGRTG